MSRKRVFGELESAILSIVRERPGSGVREVKQQLGDGDSYTTILTVMMRLVAKGELLREKDGRRYLFSLSNSVTPSAHSVLQRIKQKLFSGSTVSMVNYLIDTDEKIDDTDLAQIEKLIREARSKFG